MSPDGKSVYVGSSVSDAVARFNRNTTTGAITQPAGTAGCVSETGAGPCADGHGLSDPTSVAVSADGKSVYVASVTSSAVARLNRNTTTGAITQPAGTAGCVSETGAGPCADGHGLRRRVRGGGQRRREERLRRLDLRQRRGALQPQHDHRGDHPARRDRRLRQRDRGGALRRRPWAPRPALGGGQPRREERLRRLVRQHTGSSDSTNAVVRFNRNTTTGAITQPAGTAGCVSETGAGPCADGHGLNKGALGGGQRRREERLRRLHRQRCRGALQPGALRRPTFAPYGRGAESWVRGGIPGNADPYPQGRSSGGGHSCNAVSERLGPRAVRTLREAFGLLSPLASLDDVTVGE